jgi:hypothetical protein
LFEGQNSFVHFVADENDHFGRQLNSWAAPDISLATPEPDFGFVHRSVDGAEIYFIANTGNQRINTVARFRRDFSRAEVEPEWWDPYSGAVYPSTDAANVEERSQSMTIKLEPYESRVLVFSTRKPPASATSQVSRPLPSPIDWSEGWKVSFGDTGKEIQMDHLRSWTDDEKTRYFSGLATYVKTVLIPNGVLDRSLELRLDFGEGSVVPFAKPTGNGIRAWMEAPVREAAVVYVNGKRAGSVWHPPYAVDVTNFLHSGENEIRVVVGNLAINELAGRSLPDYRLLNLRYGARFTAEDMKDIQPVPAGILGHIHLVAQSAQHVSPAN